MGARRRDAGSVKPLFTVRGRVVPGDGRGRALGFPTANLDVPLTTAPPGIYACWVELDEAPARHGVLHIGPRPTFTGADSAVEVHILSFPDCDLYGRHLTVVAVKKIRDIEAYRSGPELAMSIAHDCAAALTVLAPAQSGTGKNSSVA